MVRAADAAAQLVQLGEAEAVGAVDDDGVGRRDVDAALDDGRAQQHVEPLRGEIAHHALEIALAHLAVRHGDARLGQELREPLAHALDGVDLVVQEVHLAAAPELAHRRLADQALRPGRDERLDGKALLRGGGDNREVADAFERHGERTRDGRRGESENVHFRAQPFQRLLLAHAEAVLLVDDHQPEALELHVPGEQLVRADDDVHLAAFELFNNFAGFLRTSES
jgi:hypothetical protein